MRKSVFYLLFFFAFLLCCTTEAKVKQKPVYIFGFATAFTDSTGYITDIQCLDSAFVDTKTKFLIGRNMYSIQLQEYLEQNENCKHPITSIFFGDKKKLEKKRLSIRNRYEKYRDFTVKPINYVFTPEAYYGDEVVKTSSPKKASKRSQK